MKLCVALLIAVCGSSAVLAQEPIQNTGQADIATQAYYLKNGTQAPVSTAGVAVRFEEFIPHVGLFRGNLEGYRSESGIRPADNFLGLRDAVWGGFRWTVEGGDFRVPGILFRNPFTNLYFPEIQARGFNLQVGDSKRSVSVYWGRETLLAGPRIPFRVDTPQNAMGITARQKFGNLETGVRLLRLSAVPETANSGSNSMVFFAPGRNYWSADNLTFYTGYSVKEKFTFYGEATQAQSVTEDGKQALGNGLSYLFGPSWESARFTVRANYSFLRPTYLPIAGYWTGDRRGPYGELRIRPFSRLELFGSSSQYETTEHRSDVPFLSSKASSGGVSIQLPWKFYASAQLSTTGFRSSDPSTGSVQDSFNRQWSAVINRRIGQHTVQLSRRDMRITVNGMRMQERASEAADTFQLGHFILGAAVRLQQSAGTQVRNSLYLRGSAQFSVGRLSLFGYYEGGQDLASRTVFATNATRSSVASGTFRISRDWSVQGEAFRSQLLASINPDSLFVQGNPNLMLNPALSQFNQWSFLFRLVRTFRWGKMGNGTNLEQYVMRQIPITGSVEGFVWVNRDGRRQPVPGITVALETQRTETTDVNGKFRFESVPEGSHEVGIDLDNLPADFNPGANAKATVLVTARKLTRVDLDVDTLFSFSGNVVAVPGAQFDSLEGILIRLEPGNRYTTTNSDGGFTFYGIPEGQYQVRLGVDSLSSNAVMVSEEAQSLEIRANQPPSVVEFKVGLKPTLQKPTRTVLDERIQISK